ncbi:MAG: HAD family hydrolase, partial [Myxococcota bacterium]
MRPPPLPQQIDVLQRILERVAGIAEAGGIPVVVFDLDGTLFDNRPRTLQILLDYADEVEDEFADVAGCLRSLTVERVAYLLSTTLRTVGLTHVDVVRDITHFWRERFFSDDYLQFDLPNPGAPEYVTACHESGATILYLSARDVP